MSKCIDYPCCGHEDGGCPNRDGSFNCATCGGRLPKNTKSAVCKECHRRRRIAEDQGWDDHDHSMNY